MDDSKPKIVSLKNLTDGQCLTLKGPGEFSVGLTAEDKVICVAIDSEEAEDIIVPLLRVTVWSSAGTTVMPVNKDLPCIFNGDSLESEANLLPGNVIEVGDKQLEFSDGPVPRPRRRCLPPTPGVPILPQPPPKPQRCSPNTEDKSLLALKTKPTRPLSVRRPPPLPNDWAVIELPNTDAELLKQTRKPEQLASLASSYVTKHIHLHTDARITTELTDQIFSAMLEVAHHRRGILHRFLTDLIEEQANTSADDDRPQEPSHGAVIILLREILRQFLDPQTLVVVSLLMLRALSHVPGATQSLVECQVTSAVLGTMAALKSAATVQQYCLDVLAKIALYQPTLTQKAPLRESATDLICLSLDTHPRDITIAQGVCRVLANLAATLYAVVNSKLDHTNWESEEDQKFVNGLLSVLNYIFSKSLSPVQDTLKRHGLDLTIRTDSRRFLFIYAKLEQLRQRKDQWLTMSPPSPPPLPPKPLAPPSSDAEELQINPYDSDGEEDGGSGKGIMKRARSFENLRTPERKVKFDEDSDPDSPPSSCSSPTPQQNDSVNELDNPVQILAQRVISVPQSTDSSPATPVEKTVIGHNKSNSTNSVVIGSRPHTEGSDSSFNHDIEYENWDLLLGVLRKKSGLKNHQYSSGDLHFMARLTKTQVVALVCALAVEGNVREALSLIDQPVGVMMSTVGVPPGVQDFVARQYSANESLLDLDPGLMVGVIDAVRYKSLSFEMAQKSVLGVVRALDKEQQAPVVAVTVEFLASTITNRPLAPAMTVPSFVEEVCQELERAKTVSQNAAALKLLLNEIKLCAKKTKER